MEAQCLATVAVAEVNRGELAASVNAGHAALKIGREINNEWTQALAATNLSQGLIEEGRYGEALRTAQEGVRIARKLPDPVLPLIALYAAGNAHQAMLGLEEARTMYQEVAGDVAAGYHGRGAYSWLAGSARIEPWPATRKRRTVTRWTR